MNRQFWWQSTIAVCVSMFFGWGFELGLNTEANAHESQSIASLNSSLSSNLNSSLVCSDGTPIREKLDSDQQESLKDSLKMLSEFGGQARVLWKSCICDESASLECTALELEMMDYAHIDRLNPARKKQSL